MPWDFPGGPVVKTAPSSVRGSGSIPGQGAEIPRASWPKHQKSLKKKNANECCNKCSKGFKKWSISKKSFLKYDACCKPQIYKSATLYLTQTQTQLPTHSWVSALRLLSPTPSACSLHAFSSLCFQQTFAVYSVFFCFHCHCFRSNPGLLRCRQILSHLSTGEALV